MMSRDDFFVGSLELRFVETSQDSSQKGGTNNGQNIISDCVDCRMCAN